jgi:hypothetical protein
MAMNTVHVVRVVEYHRYRLDRGVESRGWDFLFLKKEDKGLVIDGVIEVPAKPREKFEKPKKHILLQITINVRAGTHL